MSDLAGRVALVTGGARGMGRSHALALARAGVGAVVLADRCDNLASVPYPLATTADLEAAAAAVREEGAACTPVVCDVRDAGAMEEAVGRAVSEHGSLDILLANAGVSHYAAIQSYPADHWAEIIDVNLTGVFNAIRAAAPVMIGQRWGRIVATSSMMGRSSAPGQAGYVASKWGVIGLVKAAAQDLAAFGVTVNAVAPGNVGTPMVLNDALFHLLRPDLEAPGPDDVAGFLRTLHVQPVPWLEPEEVTEAVMFLLRSAHVTGSVIDVNAGASSRFTG